MSWRVFLLGVPIDAVTMEEALEHLRSMLAEGRQHHVATPNNEMLVEASRNSEFHRVLCRAALNLPDSTGLLLMARLTGQCLPERVPGVDVVQRLCGELTEEHPVFLLGAARGVTEAAAAALKACNPRLRIAGTMSGSPSEAAAPTIRLRIADSGAQLLLVAFGAPAQELWIARHLREMPSVRVAMGVGGTFDLLAGIVPRAPKLLRTIGLEWLWRLLLQPWRIKRIWRAVVVFPWLVWKLREHESFHLM